MTEKRRIIDQLPVVHQTETLRKFFAATADHLFQPGKSTPFSGYIGRKPSYFDPYKDFYVTEPTALRQAYQLEPAMLSYDSSATINQILFYEDMVNSIRANGGNIDNQSRLFDSEYYSWAPPVDLDKLCNPSQYFWVGNRAEIPTVTMTSPSLTHLGDGIRNQFAIPDVIPGIEPAREHIQVFVDGRSVTFTLVSGEVVTDEVPNSGSMITVLRYGDLNLLLTGLPNIDPSYFTDQTTYLTNGMQVVLVDGETMFSGFDMQPFDEITLPNLLEGQFDIGETPDDDYSFDHTPFDIGFDQYPFDTGATKAYELSGVGEAIALIEIDLTENHEPRYVVMDRGARDGNPWSANNYWVHKDAISWAGSVISSNQATRPIIEFNGNMKLWNYGSQKLNPVQSTLFDDITVIFAGEPLVLDFGDFIGNTVSQVQLDNPPSTVMLDGGYSPVNGDRILVQTETYQGIYEAKISTINDNGVKLILTFELTDDNVDIGSMVITSIGSYWYDGVEWLASQSFDAIPLFDLFDANGNSLGDQSVYPGSTFAGSPVFSYAITDTATTDSVLGLSLRRNDYGQIMFENHLGTKSYEYDGGAILGYKYYLNDGGFGNMWHLAEKPTSQTETDGIATIPLNLQANPDNEEVTFISRNQWFQHFNSIFENQDGFTGQPYASNNWRDTAKDLSRGTSILQHRSPMLKTMLLASDDRFDILDAIRYVEQEYNRFRAKFTQKIVDLNNIGELDENNSADEWVDAILTSLKTNKTNDFPFAFSSMAGDNNFIPATPASFGLLQCSRPAIVTDNTYTTPVNLIRCHDGSLLPAFNDLRDNIILALEQRIFDNIPDNFKDESRPVFDIAQYIETKFFKPETGYTRAEFISMIGVRGERWAQSNSLDYRTNESFDETNPFTWNYRGTLDLDGEQTPGHWRAIYRWFFDTDRPHLTPWEMLGFSMAPTWWVTTYGTDWSRNNTTLWDHLEQGYIAAGERMGIDARYSRPGLSRIIPVDGSGKLIDPITAGIFPTAPTVQQAQKAWVMGDQGPVENLWMHTPGYRYSLASIAYLMKPVRFVSQGWDSENFKLVHGSQWVNDSDIRSQVKSLYVHGELHDDGHRVIHLGIQQWIADMMVSRGQNVDILGQALRGTVVRLAHKVAGFTSTDNMSVVADNFGLVPSEDITIDLYQSPSIREEFYSGVLIEWVGTGWRVIGYDASYPEFKMYDPDRSGPKYIISLDNSTQPVINPWRPNVFYTANSYVEFNGSVYTSNRSHTSGSSFEQEFWTAAPGVHASTAPKVTKYGRYTDDIIVVPYGTVFATRQEVSDFMLGYEQYLIAQGWKFNDVDDNSIPKDFTASVREYLSWSQVQWAEGNFVTLSPIADRVVFETTHGMILNTERTSNGIYGMVNRTGNAINANDTTVTRIDGNIEMVSRYGDIYGARVRINEIEHIMVFANITIFDDIIYQPLFNLRQPRLRVLAQRTSDWLGRLDAPGYVLIDNQITPNFDKQAEDVRTMFDIEQADNKLLRNHARHLIGYQERSYLDGLILSDTQQFEFYQGVIQQKGAPGVFNKLQRSQYIGQSRDLKFMEEFAIRLSQYGAVALNNRLSFQIKHSDTRRDPQVILFGSAAVRDDEINLTGDDTRWVDRPDVISNAFSQRDTFDNVETDLPTAGPVRLTEVDHTTFNRDGVSSLEIGHGDRIWIYDHLGTWDVVRGFYPSVDDTENNVTHIDTTAEDENVTGSRIYFENATGLTNNIIGKQIVFTTETYTTPDLIGVHDIVSVGSNWIEIDNGDAGYNFVDNPETIPPSVLVLHSMRETTAPIIDGDLYYDTTNEAWFVSQVVSGVKTVIRNRPFKMNSAVFKHALIYDLESKIIDQRLMSEPLVVDHLNIIDPVSGFIPGTAERELTFKSEFDPASYNTGSALTRPGMAWGPTQVGQLWWDMSTARFLEVETDTFTGDVTRDSAEMLYRSTYWGQLAPGSSIDVYEWVRSDVPPADWTTNSITDATGTYEGEVYGGQDNAAWVERMEYDSNQDKLTTVYYFWVKGRTTTPYIADRKIDATTVARLISNPAALDIPWIAAIAPNAVIVGGVQQFLNDTGTVLQIDQRIGDHDSNTHAQYMLMRPNDSRSLPPEWLWNKMRDSLVMFDDYLRPVPDTTLHVTHRTGIQRQPRQSMFDTANNGVLNARQSFVGYLNYVFSQDRYLSIRPEILTAFDAVDEPGDYLSWSSEVSVTVPPMPRPVDYDYKVKSIEERDKLLLTDDFITAMSRNETRRVLVDGLNDTYPNWSVWVFDPNNVVGLPDANDVGFAVIMLSLANDVYRLAKSYDYQVETIVDRNALTPEVGDRVLVNGTKDTGWFWTVYAYAPDHEDADANGYVLSRWQQFDCNDFWEAVDWYAAGYGVNDAPAVHYPSLSARNAAEGQEPINTFVQVDNDGSGNWAWTKFEDGFWNVVGAGNATLKLSDAFYDVSRELVGVSAFDGDKVSNRDGSFELRVMMDQLRAVILTDLEINQTFFSMLHFIHSQQDQVDWVFKTSFLSVGGYNEPLIQTPVEQPDNTQDLLDYIDEVKPYRVKTRDFVRSMTPNRDDALVHVTDFDKPIYYDSALGRYRRLDPSKPVDLEILTTRQPWKDWYDALINNPELLRNVKGSIKFDRVTGDDQPTYSIITSGDMLDTPDMVIEGSDADDAEWLINPNANDLRLRDPHASGHPEELMPIKSNDGLSIIVNSEGTTGNPDHIVRVFDTTSSMGDTAKLSMGSIPQSSDAVAVFRDGIRATELDDYTIDHFNREVTVNLDYGSDRASRIVIHSMTSGGATAVDEEHYYNFDVDLNFELDTEPNGRHVIVMVNGEEASYTISGTTVTLDHTPELNSDVMITMFGYGSNFDVPEVGFDQAPFDQTDVVLDDSEIRVYVEDLTYNANQTWTLAHPSDQHGPEHATTIVEVDGLRIMPPETHYVNITSQFRVIELNRKPDDVNNIVIWINGEQYSGGIAYNSEWSSISDLMSDDNVTDSFAVYDHYLVCVDMSIQAYVIATLEEDNDYTVKNGVLTIVPNVSNANNIKVTTFTNNQLMFIKTVTFYGNNTTEIKFDLGVDDDHVWANKNGLLINPSIDFGTKLETLGFDQHGFDTRGFDDAVADPSLVFPVAQKFDDRFVFTTFGGVDARKAKSWLTATTTPTNSRMTPIVLKSDFDVVGFDTEPFDSPVRVRAQSSLGVRGVFHMNNTWETVSLDDSTAMTLVNDLDDDANEIVVRGNPFNISPKLLTEYPFTLPSSEGAGVIWINGERIEFFDFDVSGDTFILTELCRGTHNTRLGNEQRISTMVAADGVQTTFTLENASTTLPLDIAVIKNTVDGSSGQVVFSPVSLTSGVDYNVVQNGNNIDVTLVDIPENGNYVSLAQTIGYSHLAGSLVYDGYPIIKRGQVIA